MKPMLRSVSWSSQRIMPTNAHFVIPRMNHSVHARSATVTPTRSLGFKSLTTNKIQTSYRDWISFKQSNRWKFKEFSTPANSIKPANVIKDEKTPTDDRTALSPIPDEEPTIEELETALLDEILLHGEEAEEEEEETSNRTSAEGEGEEEEPISIKEFINRFIEGKIEIEGDKQQVSIEGRNILNVAVRENLIEECKTLIETLHFDPNCKDDTGVSPIHLSALHKDCTLFHYLLSKGADLDATADTGERIIHVACVSGNETLVRELVQRNPKEASAETKEGCTPLHLAVEQNLPSLAQFLIDNGDMKGEQPLHLAIEKGATECLKVLLQNGANVNTLTKHKSHPFLQAVVENKLEVVKMMFEYGKPDLDIATEEGKNAVYIASDCGSIDMIQLLLDHGIKIDKGDIVGNTAFHVAAQNADVAVLEVLLKNGADVNVQNDLGETALHLAVRKALPHIIKFLIDKGADVNIKSHDKCTPLHYAIRDGQHSCAMALLDSGVCDLDAQNEEGNTALHLAIDAGYFRWVEELIKRGARINLPNNARQTPLDVANLKKRKQSRKLLLEHNAISLNASNRPRRATNTTTVTK